LVKSGSIYVKPRTNDQRPIRQSTHIVGYISSSEMNRFRDNCR